MKTKITVVAILVVTTGAFLYTRSHNGIPSDLRDAVSDGGAIDALKGYSSHQADMQLPAPAPVAAAESSLAAPGTVINGRTITRQCYAVEVSLDPAKIRGATASETRANVKRAMADKDLKELSYHDDYAVHRVGFSVAREENMLGLTSNRSKIEKALKGLPEVKRVASNGYTKDKLFWNVEFNDGLYPPDLERVFSPVGVPHSLNHKYTEDSLSVYIDAGSAELGASALQILKTFPGIKEQANGMKIAGMMVATFYADDASRMSAIGEAVCIRGSCKIIQYNR